MEYSSMNRIIPIIARTLGRRCNLLVYLPAIAMAILLCIATPLMITVFTPVTALAQTEWKDPLIISAIGDQINPSVARPSQPGYTIVAWQDDVTGHGDFRIKAQKISNYTGLPQWFPLTGIDVCVMSGAQIEPRAAYDSAGGVIVTWLDARNGYFSSVFAQRIDLATGQLDPNWPASGAPVRELDSEVEHVRIAGTADGAFISWLDHRGSAAGAGGRRVYAQYILSATGNWPQWGIWAQNGIQVSTTPGDDQEHPEIARDHIFYTVNTVDRAGCVVTYQDKTRHGNGIDYWNVMATNLDAVGNPGYDVALAVHDADQLNPRIVCGGAEPSSDQSRAIIVWQDSRQDPNVPLYDIMAQVVYANGTVSNPGNGKVICDMGESQMLPIPVIHEHPEHWPNYGDPYIPYVSVVWQDLRDAQISGIDLYGATLDARNIGLVNPSGSAGELVCALGGDQTEHALDHIDGGAELNIAWRTPGAFPGVYLNADIHHQKVMIPSWSFHRPLNGWPVTEAKGDQILPEVSGEVMVFQDRRRQPIVNDSLNDWNINCQISGECVGPTGMRWRDMWAKVTNISDAQSYRMATDDEHNVFVVWDELRDPIEGRQVYIQKFDKHGVPRWDFGGVRVSDPGPTAEAKLADVAIDNNKGAQVVWQQTSGGTEEVVYAHVAYDGTVANIYNITVADAALSMNHAASLTPVIVFTPATTVGWGAWVAFIGVDGAGNHERYVRRINAGVGVHNPNVVRLAPPSTPSEYSDLKIVHHGDDGFHLLSRWYNRNPGAPVRQLNVTTITENTTVNPDQYDKWQDQFFNYTDCTGYDIDVDVSWPVPHRPLLAVTLHRLGFAGVDLHLVSYNASFAAAGSRFSDNPWNYPGRSEIPSLPTVASDHVDVNGYGGMLVALDVEYTDQLTSLQRHKVQTAHVGLVANDLARPPKGLMDVAIGLTVPTWPDITYAEPQFAGQEPMSMIVWEGGGETSSCSPARPTEIYAQYVGYQIPYDGLYWNEEKMVAPGPGNYHQRRPTIQQSDAETYTVFWLDTWGGTASPMGTRMYHIDGDNMGWKKKHAASTPQNLAVSVYPNPVGPDAGISIQLVSVREQHARVLITDALGRTVAQLHDGMLREGVTTISGGLPRGQLPSGTYFVSTLTETGRTVTTFIVLR